MGTYGISEDELLEGVQKENINDKDGYVGFEEFLSSFEGDVSAVSVAKAWNGLAKKHKWNDWLQAIDKHTKKPIED